MADRCPRCGQAPEEGRRSARLAHAVAQLATIAPGGTRWPGYQLPNRSEVYAIAVFEGRRQAGGGPTVQAARAALARQLMRRAADDPEAGQ